MEEEFRRSLEEVVTSEDVGAAIKRVEQTNDLVSFSVCDVYRFIGEEEARLAASTLANYRLTTAMVIANSFRPCETLTYEKKQHLIIGYHFLNNKDIASVVNKFPDDNHLRLSDDSVRNLAIYAAEKEPAYRDALTNLFAHYAQNPEVVSAALSLRINEFPTFVRLLTSEDIARVIRNHSGNSTRGKLVADLIETFGRRKALDFSLFETMHEMLAMLDQAYMPKSGIKEADLEKMVEHATVLSDYLAKKVEPWLEKYRGFEHEFIDLMVDIRKSYVERPHYYDAYGLRTINTFLSIIDNAPSQRIGMAVAKLAFNLWKKTRHERRSRVDNLVEALSSEAYRDALVKADAHPHSLREIALGGLVYEAHWPGLKITENVANMLASSSYDTAEEVKEFFDAVHDSGRYLKQLHRLPKTASSLSEKTAIVCLLGVLKKRGVGTSDPSVDGVWKELAAKRAKELLLKGLSTGTVGASVDAQTREDVMLMSIDQFVDFLEIRDRPDNILDMPTSTGFCSQEFFLEKLAAARKAKAIHWQLGKEYGMLTNVNSEAHSPAEFAELFVAGLIGRVPDKVQYAINAFGSNMELARAYVMKKVKPTRVYHALKNSLEMLRAGNLRGVDGVTAYFRELVKDENLKGNKDRRGIEALSDLTEDLTGIAMEKKPINRLTAIMQDVVPSDLFDNRLLHACTFYPDGIKKGDSVSYVADPNKSLLHFYDRQNGSSQKRGVAILALEKLADGRTALLIDSVEGSPNLRLVNGWDKFSLDSIMAVARDIRVDTLLINEHVLGNTAKGFVSYVSSQEGAKQGIFHLAKSIQRQNKDGLEGITFENGQMVIKGYELSVQIARPQKI